MYQNKKYNNKWFYAFIKDMKYENDECTTIEIETDVIQTWLFDYEIKPSFVEREHVNDDTVGINTVPEGLETGEYVVNKEHTLDMYEDCEPVIAVTELPGGNDSDKQVFCQFNGLFQGCAFITGGEEGIFGDFGGIANIIKHYVDNGKAESIQSIFMAPTYLTEHSLFTKTGWKGTISYGLVKESKTPYGATFVNKNKPSTIDGYTPRNKKLLTGEYCYLNLDNNVGNCGQYKYENFSGDKFTFSYDMCLVPGISSKIYPNNYQNLVSNFHHSMSCGKLPICSWASDVYTNWMTQNGVNTALSVASGVLQIGAGLAMGLGTGGLGWAIGGGTVAGGVSTIAGTMAQVHQQSYTPPTLQGNLNGGDINFGLKLHNPTLYEMSIKKEWAERLDKFFDMFGYKVNMVKTPNKAHRGRWWYTKTIDINIDGSIPGNDMQKIKNCYNNGITFWRNADEMNNYDLSNDIV